MTIVHSNVIFAETIQVTNLPFSYLCIVLTKV